MLCRDMTSRVALVMAPLLPGIRMGVGNNGLENGGGEFRGAQFGTISETRGLAKISKTLKQLIKCTKSTFKRNMYLLSMQFS